jgi:hypothetical protein
MDDIFILCDPPSAEPRLRYILLHFATPRLNIVKLDLVDQLRIRNFRALNVVDAKYHAHTTCTYTETWKIRMELSWWYVVFR